MVTCIALAADRVSPPRRVVARRARRVKCARYTVAPCDSVFRSTCLVAAVGLQAAWLAQPYPLPAKIVQLVLLSIVIASPANGLLTLAGLGPIAYDISTLVSVSTRGPHILEGMVVAVITGALIRWRPAEPASRTATPAAIVAAVAAASAITLMPTRLLMAGEGGLTAWQRVTNLWRDGLSIAWLPAIAAIAVAEGMALVWAAERSCAGRLGSRGARSAFSLIGYSAAGLLNLYRVFAAAMRGGAFLQAAPALFLNTRYNMFYDRNAAASMFVLVTLAGVALVTRPPRRAAAVSVLLVIMLATLWLSGSRIAVLATVLVGAGALTIRLAPSGRVVWLAAASVAIALVVAGGLYALLYPAGRSDVVSFSILGRLSMAKVALRMARTAPVFGAGIGTFAERAVAFGSPFGPENAHNNALQILAEEGLAGLLAVTALVGLVLVASVLAEARERSAVRFWLVAGLAGFGLTAMTGHPLLLPEVAWPFWMTFGVLAALAPPPTRPTWQRPLAAAACVLLAISVPFRAAALRAQADLEYQGVGLSGWRTGGDIRFREAEPDVLAVPADRSHIDRADSPGRSLARPAVGSGARGRRADCDRHALGRGLAEGRAAAARSRALVRARRLLRHRTWRSVSDPHRGGQAGRQVASTLTRAPRAATRSLAGSRPCG